MSKLEAKWTLLPCSFCFDTRTFGAYYTSTTIARRFEVLKGRRVGKKAVDLRQGLFGSRQGEGRAGGKGIEGSYLVVLIHAGEATVTAVITFGLSGLGAEGHCCWVLGKTVGD